MNLSNYHITECMGIIVHFVCSTRPTNVKMALKEDSFPREKIDAAIPENELNLQKRILKGKHEDQRQSINQIKNSNEIIIQTNSNRVAKKNKIQSKNKGDRGLPAPKHYNQLKTFVLFCGFPRSGQSLVGAIMDAHPHMTIPHDFNIVGKQ